MADMNKSRPTEEQIIGFPKQAEAGVPIGDTERIFAVVAGDGCAGRTEGSFNQFGSDGCVNRPGFRGGHLV